MGLYRGLHEPQVVLEGRSRNSLASGWAPIASHHLRLNLSPGESKTYIFLLRYVENPKEAKWAAPG